MNEDNLMSEPKEKTSVVLPTFNGKADKFGVFWPRFQAYATIKKFQKLLDENKHGLPADPENLSSGDAGKAEKASIEANQLAVASFTMAFTEA